MCDRVALSGQNSGTYLPDISSQVQGHISSQVQGHKVKDTTGQVYEWDGPLPPAMLYKPTRPSEPRMHRAHNKHHCDYYRFIKKGMARHIPVSFMTSIVALFPLGLEYLEKVEGIFKSGKSQGILNRLEKWGKITQNTGKVKEFQTKMLFIILVIFKWTNCVLFSFKKK